MPPTISRFSGSSSAIRRVMSMSSALWWVMNGFAAAPPAWPSRTGVSTSVKPFSSQHPAGRRDHRGADPEDPPRGLVEGQVEVALAVAGLGVGDAVADVGQRPQALREQLELVDPDRELAVVGGDHRALDADPVAEVEVGEVVQLLAADLVAGRPSAGSGRSRPGGRRSRGRRGGARPSPGRRGGRPCRCRCRRRGRRTPRAAPPRSRRGRSGPGRARSRARAAPSSFASRWARVCSWNSALLGAASAAWTRPVLVRAPGRHPRSILTAG